MEIVDGMDGMSNKKSIIGHLYNYWMEESFSFAMLYKQEKKKVEKE